LHGKQIFNVFYFKKRAENKKNVKNEKNVTRIKNVKNVFTSMLKIAKCRGNAHRLFSLTAWLTVAAEGDAG